MVVKRLTQEQLLTAVKRVHRVLTLGSAEIQSEVLAYVSGEVDSLDQCLCQYINISDSTT